MQSKSFQISNAHLFSSYNVAFNLLSKFGLLVEHSKTEIFHFSRSHGILNTPLLDLSTIGSPILHPKETWRYLGFIFDRKLLFHQHIDFYTNKAISTVKCMKMLGNSMRGLSPHQKHLLYRSCALPIALYGFQMWFYTKAPLSYLLKILGKLQRYAALWITGAFKTAPSLGIEVIASLIFIQLHLQKLSGRSELRVHALPDNHILQSLMANNSNSTMHLHLLSLSLLTGCQYGLIKGHLVDMDN